MVNSFFVGAIAGAFEQVQQVAFGILEEMDVATTGSGAGGLCKFHAFMFQFFAGGLDGIHPECDMAETSEFIVAGVAEVAGRGIDFEHAAGELDEEGRGFVNGKNEFCAEGADIPVFEGESVVGGQADVFDSDFHR